MVYTPLNSTLQEAFGNMDMEGDFFLQASVLGLDEEALLKLNDANLNNLISELGGVKEGAITAG